MASFKVPTQDMKFVLTELFDAPALWNSIPHFEEVSEDLAMAILEEGAKLSENEVFPINRSGDEEGCTWDDGKVTTPSGFKEAFQTYAESGWTSLGGNPEFGGQGLPKMLTCFVEEMFYAANSSFALYPALTNGATLAIDAHGSQALKEQYLPKLYDGSWSASMCLTEAHSGTDLGLIRTKAEDQGDGTYLITGTKIFITGGEHDLTENIIHLVLAKLPGAPAGPKGISLFMVPKIKVDSDNNLGDGNNVSCGSIEHKMGLKGSSTCVMNFDGSEGYLVGEVNKGLAAMFTMMNYERLTVGLQGVGLSEVSYQSAREYAQDRLQSRAPTGAVAPEKMADPIIVHPDVRRMLLTQKAYAEGNRAFASFVAMKLDIAKHHPDSDQRNAAQNMVALLTPVAKAFFSDRGLDACILGQQVFGGHGYVREWGMEQMVRDARIAQIYEGTNGIQALDLMGRKVAANSGEWLYQYCDEMEQYIETCSQASEIPEFIQSLKDSIDVLKRTTEYVLSESASDVNVIGAASCDYLNLLGLVTLNYLWVRMAAVSSSKTDDHFYSSKVKTGQFFVQKLLPEIQGYAAKVRSGADSLMQFNDNEF